MDSERYKRGMEIIIQMLAYCGLPTATNALIAAEELFDELDKKDSSHGK